MPELDGEACLNLELMKEKLYTPVVGDILDQMGYKHQFLPAPVRPLAAQVPTEPYKLRGEQQDNRLKVAGYACTVLENDVFECVRLGCFFRCRNPQKA